MRRVVSGIVMFLAGMSFLPAPARAQAVLQERCMRDSLPVELAEARVEWARRCALTVNVGDPSQHTDGEYYEPSGSNVYLSDLGINFAYVSRLYNYGQTYQTIDMDGYLKWSRDASRKKARPLYGIYGITSDINTSELLYPHPSHANCTLYSDPFGYNPVSTFYINGYCEGGDTTPLTNGTLVGSLTASTDHKNYYALTVPAGVSRLSFETSGGTGDVDLYVKFGSAPTLASYDCRPFVGGNSELCTINNPSPGTWYVMLHGWASYSNVTLVGRY